jgi:hypothetical protein
LGQIIVQLREDGVKTPTINLLKDGKLIDAAYEVLDVIARKDIILATAHVSHQEAFALVKAAKERGVKRIVITHVDFPTTFYTVDEQKELAKYGAYMEHCYTTWATGKVDFGTTLEQIKAMGAERVILGTDLGQKTAPYPDEGLQEFANKLYDAGVSEADIRRMIVDNPAALIG